MIILAIGAHPDDVEIGMGGTLAAHAASDDIVYICNLTQAELSSNGTIQIRQQEADKSAFILNITRRYQLHFPDRGIVKENPQYSSLVSLIRELKPDVVFAPYEQDRHPDHGDCSTLVREALFDAGIRKFPNVEGKPHKVRSLYHYFINGFHAPDFYIDISDWLEQKENALRSYQSQFVKKEGSIVTPLTEGYIERVKARDILFGKEAGVAAAEGFKQAAPFVFSSIPQRSS